MRCPSFDWPAPSPHCACAAPDFCTLHCPGLSGAEVQTHPGHGPPLWREGSWMPFRYETLKLLPGSRILNFWYQLPVGESKDTNLFQCTSAKDFQIQRGWSLFLAQSARGSPPRCRGTNPFHAEKQVRFEKGLERPDSVGEAEGKAQQR